MSPDISPGDGAPPQPYDAPPAPTLADQLDALNDELDTEAATARMWRRRAAVLTREADEMRATISKLTSSAEAVLDAFPGDDPVMKRMILQAEISAAKAKFAVTPKVV